MRSVADAWSVEAYDTYRNVSQSTQISWKKAYSATYRPFTIGVSTIGGGDGIASSGAITSDWNKYLYSNESEYVVSVEYERALNMPLGGLHTGIANVVLDNTSGRFTPRVAGGTSELFTAQKPRRPINITAGFDYSGINNLIPQFIGITSKTPEYSRRSATVSLEATDFIGYLQNKYLDQTAMYTAKRSDEIIATLLTDLGFATAQYDLDYGINQIPFAMFEKGARFSDVIHELAQAENAHVYQDEEGLIKFENRQHWDNYPHFNVQRVLPTSMVIDAEILGEDHIINVVEISSQVREKQPTQVLWQLSGTIEVPALSNYEIFINFNDPVLQANRPSGYVANTAANGSGTDISSSVSVKSFDAFAQAAKLTLYNSNSVSAFLTNLVVTGRPAKVTSEVYYREQRDLSVTAYEERPIKIDNPYIQNASWAQSYAGIILNDFASGENLQQIKIRALPELQLGDLISWQGRHWRIYGIKTKVSSEDGFVQELALLQRTIRTYFRVGISTIGGSDRVAP